MGNVINITKKELKSYFISPIAYVIATVFLIITGYMYWKNVMAFNAACFRAASLPEALKRLNVNRDIFISNFRSIIVTIMYMMPIITMRIFSEEKKNKTMELLMTSPVTVPEVVFGKFLASFILYAGIIGTTLYMPLFISTVQFTMGDLYWTPILVGYLGVLMLGSVFLAIGIFASSLTENQIVAAVISFGFILMFTLIDAAAAQVQGLLRVILSKLSLVAHSRSFFNGVIDSRDVIYYLSFMALALFLTFRVVESKRWTQ